MKRCYMFLLAFVWLAIMLIPSRSRAVLYVLEKERLSQISTDEISRPAWVKPDYDEIIVASRESGEEYSELYKYNIYNMNSEVIPITYNFSKKEVTVSDNGVVYYSMESGSGYGKKIYKYPDDTPKIDVGSADAGEPFYFETSNERMVFFASNYDDVNYNIWVYYPNREEAGQSDTMVPVLWPDAFPGDQRAPSISTDGNWLAFKSKTDSDTDWEIYIVNVYSYIQSGNFPIKSSNEAIKLTDNEVDDEDPFFSPVINGHTYIVYTSQTTYGGRDIYVMDIQERSPIRLTSNPVNEFAPSWSHIYSDGTTKIAYLRTNEYGKNDVWLMTIRDEEKPKNIINDKEVLVYPNPYKIKQSSKMYIKYVLLYPAEVTIRIFDLAGGLVREINANTEQSETNGEIGENYFAWDGKNGAGETVSSGIYFFRIDTKSSDVKDKYIGKFVVIN